MNGKKLAHPFNPKKKKSFGKSGYILVLNKNHCPKISLLSSRQTKNQPQNNHKSKQIIE